MLNAQGHTYLKQHYAYTQTLFQREKWVHIDNHRLRTKKHRGFLDVSKLSLVEEASDPYRKVLRNQEMVFIQVRDHVELHVTPEAAKRFGQIR